MGTFLWTLACAVVFGLIMSFVGEWIIAILFPFLDPVDAYYMTFPVGAVLGAIVGFVVKKLGLDD